MEYAWALHMPEEHAGSGRGTDCLDANFSQKKSFINHFPELSVLLAAPSGWEGWLKEALANEEMFQNTLGNQELRQGSSVPNN